jgi:cysteine synthase A
MLYENILGTVGDTPLVRLNRINAGKNNTILAKLEYFNPGSSVKDRIGKAMVEDAEKRGVLRKGMVIVEPTAGNTGIALAIVAAVKGYRLKLLMPDSMSIERRKILKALGAELELTPAAKGMGYAVERAKEIAQSENGFMPNQFANMANPKIHEKTTAREIWKDTKGKLDVFVAGAGTGGTVSGVGKMLKRKNPSIRIIAVEPSKSPVLSGGGPSPHKIQGIGPGFVPEVFDRRVVDEIVAVSEEDAMKTARRLAREEGIFAGISSGANLAGALKVAENLEGKTIVVIIPDTGERYLSGELFEV